MSSAIGLLIGIAIGWLGVRVGYHYGAAAAYAEMARQSMERIKALNKMVEEFEQMMLKTAKEVTEEALRGAAK